MHNPSNHVPIAVIGMACHYPGATTPLELWENVLSRRQAFRRFPKCRLPDEDYISNDRLAPDKTYAHRAAVIDGFHFDWATHRIPKSTVRDTDVVHWLALETALSAISDAGLDADALPGETTGIIIGNTLTGEQTRSATMRLRWPYVRRCLYHAATQSHLNGPQLKALETAMHARYKAVFPPVTEDTLAGGLSNTIAGRICHYLDLQGGGYAVDGACSSSLLAVATGVERLTSGDMDMAIIGGVDISLDPFELVGFAKTGALTPGDMNVYDRRGQGFIPGEGCGFVVLQRLEDARRSHHSVYAIIDGWGISSDGRGTGITAPTVRGQVLALERAFARTAFTPGSLDFIEGHGTGTAVGDPIELNAIHTLINSDSNAGQRTCGVTSLKSIIGHTKAASGIGGFIKAAMAVNRRVIPPIAGCQEPHPIFENELSTIYPVLHGDCRESDQEVRAGVSSMGFGGINCHVILYSGDGPNPNLDSAVDEDALLVSAQSSEVFVLSADSSRSMARRAGELAETAMGISTAELTDLAAHVAEGVSDRDSWRAALIVSGVDDLVHGLNTLGKTVRHGDGSADLGGLIQSNHQNLLMAKPTSSPRIGMLFPGQGSQQLNMARVLIQRFQWARDMLNLAEHHTGKVDGLSLGQWIMRDSECAGDHHIINQWELGLGHTAIAQPAICLASTLWLTFLESLRITPAAVGGHSLGEVTALYASGALDADTMFAFAARRGRVMGQCRVGAMAALGCGRDQARTLLDKVDGYVALANFNAPDQTVVSGEIEAVDAVTAKARSKGLNARRLAVSGAFHSQLMDDAVAELLDAPFLPQRIGHLDCDLFSTVTGGQLRVGDDLGPHLHRQIVSPVDFSAMVNAMSSDIDLFLEVGPGRVLAGLAKANLPERKPDILAVEPQAEQWDGLNRMLAVAFVKGAEIYWPALYQNRLVRPFTAPRDKLFIANHCETEIESSAAAPLAPDVDSDNGVHMVLAGLADLSADRLGNYLQHRGKFISRVIKADMEDFSDTDSSPFPNAPFDAALTGSPPPQASQTISQGSNGTLYEHMLILVEEITGFDPQTISPKSRLLDDLNMDSIKAGDLLIKLAHWSGVQWPDDPRVMANARLEEIESAIMQLQARQTDQPPLAGQRPRVGDIAKVVATAISHLTGFDTDSLTASLRLVDDLNLDSIKIGDVLVQSAREAGVSIDPQSIKTPLETIADLVLVIEEHRSSADIDISEPVPTIAAPEWVRNFRMEWIQRPLDTANADGYFRSTRVLVLHSASSGDLVEVLRDHLEQAGAATVCRDFEWALKTRPEDLASFPHRIAVMPSATCSDPGQLRRILSEMVAQRAVVAQSASETTQSTTFLQFGGGRFGRNHGNANLPAVACTAIAAGLYHEFPQQRVCVVDLPSSWPAGRIANVVRAEISSATGFSMAGYDDRKRRWEWGPQISSPVVYVPRGIQFTDAEVILVSGGAKGITAECALTAAKEAGGQLALLGTTPLKAGSEIEDHLERLANEGVRACYYACDITKAQNVARTVERIRKEQGPIRALIHGAGLNRPRPASRVSPEEALVEIEPKILGLINLWEALKKTPPELVVGLSSIIGITGMPGNVWYGFANEALDILLQAIDDQSPNTRTQSVAFSVWRDAGMGARMGSVTRLARMGIDAIPVQEGRRRFAKLFTHDPQTPTVIVTARLGGLDTWCPPLAENPPSGRYCRHPRMITPGIEAEFSVHLDLEQDLYLQDHLFQGSFLFPTVFGLEAMTQAALAATGKKALGEIRIENVRLNRPITVDPKKGADLVVWAHVLESELLGEPVRILAGVRKIDGVNNGDHFTATVVLDSSQALELGDVDSAGMGTVAGLSLEPMEDLYRESLLFQGPRFQRIEKVYSLEGNNTDKGCGLLQARCESASQAGASAFGESIGCLPLLPDPFFTDALLQSAALLVPQDTSLPIAIDCIHYFPGTVEKEGVFNVEVVLEKREDQTFHTHVTAMDEAGRPFVHLEGYRLKILKHVDAYPTLDELKSPEHRDRRLMNEALDQYAQTLNVHLPELELNYVPGIHSLAKGLRHAAEIPLMMEFVHRAAEKWEMDGKNFSIDWLKTGKPVLRGMGNAAIGISISHDQRLCLAALGMGEQGCDIAQVEHRTRDIWLELLGRGNQSVFEELIKGGDRLDEAGTRIWSAQEAAIKAMGTDTRLYLEIQQREGSAVLLKASSDAHQTTLVLTAQLQFTWGGPKVLAVVVTKEKANVNGNRPSALTYPPDFAGLCQKPAYEILPAGPHGELVFVQRFPVTFKPSAQLSRYVYFTHFFDWMGHAREASTWPVMKDLIALLGTGEWGSVTNFSRLQVFGEVRTGDLVQLRMWTSDNSGPRNGTMTLQYEFVQLLPDNNRRLLALSELQTTWVALTGPGIAKPAPYPKVLQTFFDDMIPKERPLQPDLGLPATLKTWHSLQEIPLYQAALGPMIRPQLAVDTFETSLGQANAVGNVYYANYYEWQGAMRDHYLHRWLPEYFGGIGESGEAICLECRVDHLREAMPFDRILVTMALKSLFTSRAELYFDYYRMDDSGAPVKLAWGSHQMVWVERDSKGQPREVPFPDPLRRAFESAIQKETETPLTQVRDDASLHRKAVVG